METRNGKEADVGGVDLPDDKATSDGEFVNGQIIKGPTGKQ